MEQFNWKQYLENYEDLITLSTPETLWRHYQLYGKREGRTDRPLLNIKDYTENKKFDWKQYLENYEYLKQLGVNTKITVLHHYTSFGRFLEMTDKPHKLNLNDNNSLNIMCVACHFTKKSGLKVLINNLNFLLTQKISKLIIVYSMDPDINLEIETLKILLNSNLSLKVETTFLYDIDNKYLDFGKYNLLYNHIISSNIKFDKILLINDSIVLLTDLKYITNGIIETALPFIGVLESHQIKQHSQSWWLNFDYTAFLFWAEKIKDNLNYKTNIILDLEVNLGNEIINRFEHRFVFPSKQSMIFNLMFDNDVLYESYIKYYNFKFIKIKRLLNNPPRPMLSDYIVRLIPEELRNVFFIVKKYTVEKYIPYSMSLVELADNTRTDKNTGHSYLDLYQELLMSKKETAKNVLEIGIWITGGSIKLWSDYFTNATIHGLDIKHIDQIWDGIKNNPRIVLHTSTDAYNEHYFNHAFKGMQFDFMLDDGPHSLESMKIFIRLYSQLMTPDGILIIEDVQDIAWLEELKNEVPEDLKPYIKTYDLRHVKGRYDDIVFTINKSI